MYKRFTLGFLALLLLLLGLYGGAVYVLDPMFHYHEPWTDLPPVSINERYQVGGIARNFRYDNIVVGTSVTANFRASWFEESFGGKTIKLTLPGGSFEEVTRVLDMAYEQHAVQRVFWGIDTNLLCKDLSQYKEAWPDYLYNDNPFDDVQYLLNKDVVLRQVVNALDSLHWDPVPTLDDLFTWENRFAWGKESVLSVYDRPEPVVMMTDSIFDEELQKNLAVITAYIKAHPDTEFYLFIPPYSIVYWDQTLRQGTTEAILHVQQQAMISLSSLPNTHVYDFMNDGEIICDLDQYTDPVHYSPAVNRRIVQVMAAFGGVQGAMIPDAIQAARDLIYNYPFDELFGEEMPASPEIPAP